MRIVVIGAGAIGTLYAAKLSQENRVTLVVRRQEHAERIRAEGVRISGLESATYRVDASPELQTIEPGSLILLTTKVYDSATAIVAVRDLLRPDTVILCLQNGLHSERIVRDAVADRCVVSRGITDFGVIYSGPGEIVLKAHGPTLIEAGARSADFADLFTRAGLNGRVSADIRHDVWRKLVVNCVINPLTAITGMEVGWVGDERLDPLKRRLVAECVAVARREGVTLDGDLVQMLNERYGPSRNLSSMHQDLARGNRTEIDYMNGAVAELGRAYGIPCPINEGLAAIIRALEPPRETADAATGVSAAASPKPIPPRR